MRFLNKVLKFLMTPMADYFAPPTKDDKVVSGSSVTVAVDLKTQEECKKLVNEIKKFSPTKTKTFKDAYVAGHKEGKINRVFIKKCVGALRNAKITQAFGPTSNIYAPSVGIGHNGKLVALSGFGILIRTAAKVEPKIHIDEWGSARITERTSKHDESFEFRLLDPIFGIDDALINLEVKDRRGKIKSFREAAMRTKFKGLADGLERRYLK